jgi:hypothetical protein
MRHLCQSEVRDKVRGYDAFGISFSLIGKTGNPRIDTFPPAL